MADKTEWVVDGFQFGTQQDADLAQNEWLRIERLEENWITRIMRWWRQYTKRH